MSSAVLVNGESGAVQAPETELGLRIVAVESQIQRISAGCPGGGIGRWDGGQFGFDVSMTEKARTSDSMSVSFTFSFGKKSNGQSCEVSGEAVFRFSSLHPSSDLHAFGSEIDNEMAVAVFRQNFETIYLLHQALGLESPSPWVTQDVSISSRGIQG